MKRPEQQKNEEKMRESRQSAAGSLQIQETIAPFLPVSASLSVRLGVVASFTLGHLAVSAVCDIQY